MEMLELKAGDEIRDFVSARLRELSDSFSVLKVGHITTFPEPVNASLGIAETLEAFAARPEADSFPVEGDSGVIGIIHRKDLQRKRTGLMAVTDPPVERFIDRTAFSVDASENCEKAMALILGREPDHLYDDFMIYERGRYFGIGSFADLSRAIAEIRQADLVRARGMQEFLMTRNAVGDAGIAVERYVKMAHEIGGDFLQCMTIREGLSLLACFDVCGKGTAASLVTGVLSSFFSTLKSSGALASSPPSAILETLNRVVMDQTPEELFVAGVLAFVDRAKGELTFFNCGYSPIYLFYTDEESGRPKGKVISPDLWPLGINEFVEPRGMAFPLYKNLRLFIHSDGLTDACDERGERFGDEGLRKFLYPRCMKRPKALLAELDAELAAFVGTAPQADDITVLAAEIS